VLLAFFLAAVLALVVTLFAVRRLRAGLNPRPVSQVVASATDLPAGVALSAKDMVLIDWPTDVPLPGSFNKTEAVLGHPLIRSMGAKQPILQRDLGVEGSGIGLATKIPPGMRATAIRSNEIVGVAGFLYPGSHVDVLATYTLPGVTGSITHTVLQDVEVLTAGQTIEPDPQGKPQQVSVVTLLLSPEDSQKLQLASTQGAIQFVLRNGVDNKSVELRPTRVDQLIATGKPAETPAPKPRPTRRITVVPSSTTYVLEVIQGTKRTVHKFDQDKQEQGTK
jgi:pilus assembly protein CpaB